MTAVAEACFGFLPYYLAWEIINISLEFTATAWVREPRWFCAVLGVNIVTHPLFVVLLETYGRTPLFILLCEACIVCVESLLLMVAFGFRRWRSMLGRSLIMNAASYGTGLMLG